MDIENQTEAWRDINPILSPPTAPKSTQTSQPKKAPAAIRALLVDMAARYRPTDPSRVAAHVEQLDLLASDLADAPTEKLRAAIAEWVRNSRWMPRASDLWDIIRRQATSAVSIIGPSEERLRYRVETGNRMLDEAGRIDVRWIIDNGGVRLMEMKEIEARMARQRDPAGPNDIARLKQHQQAG